VATNLPLPHKPQKGDGYCLPACVQVVLAYLGISRSQDAIIKTLGLNPPFGFSHAPTFSIRNDIWLNFMIL
jgi:hypothetical protein